MLLYQDFQSVYKSDHLNGCRDSQCQVVKTVTSTKKLTRANINFLRLLGLTVKTNSYKKLKNE